MAEHVTDQERDAAGEAAAVTPQPLEAARKPATARERQIIFDVDDINVFYGPSKAIRNVTLDLYRNEITALIGPSGCGKSTFIRCLNRMNDLIPAARVEGRIVYHGEDLYASDIDPVQVRKRIGMVFQKPNPFPKSIYDNIAFGPRLMSARPPKKGDMDEIVEQALRRGALWDEVKDRLKTNAFGMSGGQQQRLCIARALATEPDVLLMDEPCSALDPISTGRIEDLMMELKRDYSIVIVTHNMQQAARVSDMTAFFTVELKDDGKDRTGAVVEYAETDKIFTNPDDKRTEDYVTGKFG
jgi:phosphate transport system ATP-binding protein